MTEGHVNDNLLCVRIVKKFCHFQIMTGDWTTAQALLYWKIQCNLIFREMNLEEHIGNWQKKHYPYCPGYWCMNHVWKQAMHRG
jgi:hypothetical protein